MKGTDAARMLVDGRGEPARATATRGVGLDGLRVPR